MSPLLWMLLAASTASAADDYNVAGSAQLDYHLVPRRTEDPAPPGTGTSFRGFTMELALKVAVDISDHLSANIKACYGCHGVEADMAYFDYRVFDELDLRVGRFSPSFGAFNLRHDPANHLLSDKPLPYDMGRMLRKGEWNNGVLPSPFPTNGVEVNGSHWFGNHVQLDYAVYLVASMKNGADPNPTDLDFQESHLPYYVGSTPQPASGARLAVTIKAGSLVDLSVGSSAMYGRYDPRGRLSYAIVGADFAFRVRRTALRAEYLLRRQQMDVENPDIFKYAVAPVDGDFFIKQGGLVELEGPLVSGLDWSGRFDGMARNGNVSDVPVGSGRSFATTVSPLVVHSYVLRETLGLAYNLERNLRLKASGELWQFNTLDAYGRSRALSFHFSAVGSF